MTEELEKKLNELLGLKKLLEEATDEKQKTVTTLVVKKYRKKAILNWVFFWLSYVLGMTFIVYGVIVYQLNHDVVYIDCPTIIIAGLLLMLVAKVCWLIRKSKLTILQEMKQFELRIMEKLKK